MCNGGVILCADALISGGMVSSHKSKIGGDKFNDGVALFALAGHVHDCSRWKGFGEMGVLSNSQQRFNEVGFHKSLMFSV